MEKKEILQSLRKKNLIILAIDTSFDETSVSVSWGTKILSNLLPSQKEIHSKFGGVVPNLARFAHIERIDSVVKEALDDAQKQIEEIDLIAVTVGPGLAITLEVGLRKACEIASKYGKPILLINHMLGHLFSPLANEKHVHLTEQNIQFPILSALVSGNHTELVFCSKLNNCQKIGNTIDDAAGEAFDKCGRLLGLDFPAGPKISQIAAGHRDKMKVEIIKTSNSVLVRGVNNETGTIYELPVPMVNSGNLNFSYSGLKTALKYLIEEKRGRKITMEEQLQGNIEIDSNLQKDICVVFEEAAIRQIIFKLEKAIKEFNPVELWIGGGVVANPLLQKYAEELSNKYNLTFRKPKSKLYIGDNAAMIATTASVMINSFTDDQLLSQLYVGNFDQIDRIPSLSI